MFKKVPRNLVVLARFLNAFFIVNVHIEISAVLLGECNAFVIDQRGMLNGSDTGADGVLDTFWGVRVGFHSKTEILGFVDGCLQFFGGELGRVRIAAVSEDGARGEHFDVIHAVVREQAHLLTHFPGAVGLAVVQVPGKLNVGSEASHGAGAAGDGDVGSGDEHAGTHNVAVIDGVAKRGVIESAVDANITNGCETGFQGNARIGDGFEDNLGGGTFELRHGVCVVVISAVRQMRVAVD